VSASEAVKNIARDKYCLSSMIFLARADKAQFGTLIEDLNNSYLAGNDQYPVSLNGTLTLVLHYQGHRGSKHMDDDKNVSRETSFAQRKPRKAQQLARICCWNCNEYGHYQSDCPEKKKMHGTQMSEAKKMIMKMGLQALDHAKMGLQVLGPAQGCNGQVRPRLVLHGSDNHECSNSAFVFQRKNRKSVLTVCAIRLNGQTGRVIGTVRIRTRTVAIPQ
jgi:hypothetical protein